VSEPLPEWARGLISEQDLGIPVTIAKSDGRALSVADLLARPEDAVAFADLGPDAKTMLARLALAVMPGFRVRVSSGVVDAARALAEIDGKTRDGRALRDLVVTYLRSLNDRVRLRKKPYEPRSPDPGAGSSPDRDPADMVLVRGRGVLVIDGGDDGAPPELVSRRMSLYPTLQRERVDLHLCTGERATREVVLAALGDSIGLVAGFGHGDPSEFFGRAGTDPIFRVGGEGADRVAKKIVHLMGCEAAAELGPALVREHGALAFFGYAERIVYPASGEAADAALEAAVKINADLVDGKCALDVHENALNAFDALSVRFQDDDPLAAAAFRNMRDAFRSPASGEEFGFEGAALEP
jgi:hypothetical protein